MGILNSDEIHVAGSNNFHVFSHGCRILIASETANSGHFAISGINTFCLHEISDVPARSLHGGYSNGPLHGIYLSISCKGFESTKLDEALLGDTHFRNRIQVFPRPDCG